MLEKHETQDPLTGFCGPTRPHEGRRAALAPPPPVPPALTLCTFACRFTRLRRLYGTERPWNAEPNGRNGSNGRM
jgi:hypothetical protein